MAEAILDVRKDIKVRHISFVLQFSRVIAILALASCPFSGLHSHEDTAPTASSDQTTIDQI